MGDKIKYATIALAGVLVLSIYGLLHTQILKKSLERERDALKIENVSLNKKAAETQEKLLAVQASFDKALQEKKELESKKEQLQGKYDFISKEREELILKIESLKAEQKNNESGKDGASAPSGDAYWGGVLKSKTELENEVVQLNSELKQVKINLEQVARDKNAAELELKNLLNEKNSLEQQSEYNKGSLDSLGSELVREKNAKRSLQESVRFLKNENIILKQQVKLLSGYKINLEKKTLRLQEDKADLKRKFNEMSVVLEDKYSQIGELKEKVDNIRQGPSSQDHLESLQQTKKESIELPPIVVHAQPEGAQAEDIERYGKILAINKENNFVIIDMGENYKIKIGQNFSVYDGNKSIANICVIEVRQDISACDIKKQTSSIKVGDVVK